MHFEVLGPVRVVHNGEVVGPISELRRRLLAVLLVRRRPAGADGRARRRPVGYGGPAAFGEQHADPCPSAAPDPG